MNQTDEGINELTKKVMRAGGIGDAEAERIGSAPFLHARLRARIEAERRGRAEQTSGWLATLFIASRAIAVLMVVTIAAAVAFWFSKPNAPANNSPVNSVADNVGRVVTGGTCALSATDECAISTEEVLATLFAEEEGKTQK
ncbi:MAG: hypothetical protein WAV20_11290 [Blastocatellia bacterium]